MTERNIKYKLFGRDGNVITKHFKSVEAMQKFQESIDWGKPQ